nr:hypothetical protein [Tanacetum cinerariifolium]
MSLTFADTHNMVAYLNKSDASKGFNQVIDFLNGSHIKLQALVDRKNVVISEAVIRDALRLADAEGVDCLPNEEIFTGLARVETPLFEGMLVAGEPEEQDDEDEQVAQDLEITNLKTRVKKLERANKVKALKLRRLKKVGTSQRIESSDDTIIEDVSNQGRMIDKLDRDEEVQEVVEVVTTAKLITEVVTTASAPISTASTIILAAEPKIHVATITAASVKVAIASTRRRRGVVIRDPEEESTAKVEMDEAYARKLHEKLNQDIDWDVVVDHVKQKAKEDPYVQRYQMMKKRPQTEAQARRNMIMYLKNTVGFRLDYFKGMKVHVVDYQIIQLNNKPRYKIIRADGTHQLYVSFITLLKNFDREDLESLWSIVKEKFSTSKPNNYFDDYLLTTLRAIFGRPDGQDQVWKSQRKLNAAKHKLMLLDTAAERRLLLLSQVKIVNEKCCC